MQATYVYKPERIDYTNETGTVISRGDIVINGNMTGVALNDMGAGETGVILLEGVFEVQATPADEFAVGDVVYWNSTTKLATKTKGESTNVLGYAAEKKTAAANMVVVVLAHYAA